MTIGPSSPYAMMPCAGPPPAKTAPGPAPVPCGAGAAWQAAGGANVMELGTQLQAGLAQLQQLGLQPGSVSPPPAAGMRVVSGVTDRRIGTIQPDGTYVPEPGAFRQDDPSAFRAQLTDLLKRRGSPMADSVDALVASSLRHGVDPRLMVAIAGQESEFGTTNPDSLRNNPFGFFWNGDSNSPFSSWEEGYERVATRLGEMIHDQGFTSVYRLGEGDPNVRDDGYCEVGAGNDPTGLNSGWIGGVSAMYRELGGNPDDVRLPG
jgi:hypothetical protein